MPDQVTTECPPQTELEKLLHGRCTDARNAALCEHVGACPECQKRLDKLCGSCGELAEHLREAENEPLPKDSAYWRAMASAEEELRRTVLFPTNGEADTPHPEGEPKLDFLQPPDKPNRLGKIGPFDIVRVVGRGGMGVVLHGYDPSLDRDIAIKVIDPQLANNEVARQRFCREARAAAAVTHDNLVAVHQVNEDEPSGLPYLVMQLINGESLEQRLRRTGKLSVPEVAKLGMQAAAGLAAAHAGGLIHRDIKPANILLESPSDRVKLTDFGLARAAEDVKLTRTGFVAGSPLYMAPEQARGDEVDPRRFVQPRHRALRSHDRDRPFRGKIAPRGTASRLRRNSNAVDALNGDVPKWLSDAVDKLLSKEPAGRYQSAAEVAEVFASGLAEMHLLSPLDVPAEVCAGSRTVVARTPICWKTVGHRTKPWVGGAVLGGLLVGLLWAFTGRDHSPVPESRSEPELPAGAITTAADLARRLEDPKTTEVALAPGTFDLSAILAGPGKRAEFVVSTHGPTRLILSAPSGPEPKAILQGETGAVFAIAFIGDDRLVMGLETGVVKIWNLTNSAAVKTLKQQKGTVWTADVSADKKFLVTACDDSSVAFWNLETLATDPELSFPQPTSTKAAVFSPVGKFLATGDRNSTVRVWDWVNQIPVELTGHSGAVHSLAYSPDGIRLASAGSDGVVRVWNLKEINWERREGPARAMELTEHRGSVYGVAFSPDGTKIASAGSDGFVRIWDAGNGTQIRPIKAHTYDAWSVSFGGGGKWVASAGLDGFVKVWEVDTGKEVFSYHAPQAFHVVRFASDGTTLAAGSRDGTIRVWDVKK